MKTILYSLTISFCWIMIAIANRWVHMLGFSWLGAMILISWVVIGVLNAREKEVSKYSKVLIKMRLKERIFYYITIPIIFFLSVSGYVFFLSHEIMSYTIIVISSIVLYVYMRGIDSTYQRYFYITPFNRVLFTLMNMAVFYLFLSLVYAILPGNVFTGALSIFFVSFGLLFFDIIMRKIASWQAIVVAAISSLLMTFIVFLNGWLFIIVGVLYFFMIISYWQIYLSGARKIEYYLPPLMFIIMALLIVLL